MKSQNLAIGFLSITALILFIAQFLPVQPAVAAEALKDRDFSIATARSTRGGDTVYIIDNRSDQIAVFTWDAGQRGLQLSGVGPVSGAFQ
ncbi:MAG TPA: hypothetical protein VHD56_17035 [Tepidisphaeraceae bacterium]|nr:hypothetical protein [Tepidisphaeraceae bacterium]